MKKLAVMGILLITLGVCLLYNSEIIEFVIDNFVSNEKETSTLINNKYALNNNYDFVKITNNFTPNNKQDILNI